MRNGLAGLAQSHASAVAAGSRGAMGPGRGKGKSTRKIPELDLIEPRALALQREGSELVGSGHVPAGSGRLAAAEEGNEVEELTGTALMFAFMCASISPFMSARECALLARLRWCLDACLG